MSRRPALDAPVVVSKFWKNRRHDIIQVSLSTFEGSNLVNIREHFTDAAGVDRPTRKGIAMTVRRLPALAKAVNDALAKAVELGLITDAEGDE